MVHQSFTSKVSQYVDTCLIFFECRLYFDAIRGSNAGELNKAVQYHACDWITGSMEKFLLRDICGNSHKNIDICGKK